MRLTLRNKLMGVAAIAGLAFVLGFATSFVIEARVNRELTRIQKAHLPRLELEPRLEAEFERLNRGFQDAVAAHDNDALIATSSVRERFERELQQGEHARASLPPPFPPRGCPLWPSTVRIAPTG